MDGARRTMKMGSPTDETCQRIVDPWEPFFCGEIVFHRSRLLEDFEPLIINVLLRLSNQCRRSGLSRIDSLCRV